MDGSQAQGAVFVAPEEEDTDLKEAKKLWAQLIQKIYDVTPLECPRCRSEMRIIAYIDKWETILRILKHLELWPLVGPKHCEG